MIKDIVLPDLGEGIESATISEVPLGVGEQVKKDDVLLVLESDKASMEIPSDYDGKIIEVLIKEGEDVATGETLFKVETQDGLEEKVKEKVEEKTEKEVEVEKKVEEKPETGPTLELSLIHI